LEESRQANPVPNAPTLELKKVENNRGKIAAMLDELKPDK
jgi:hypothetical protein